ncbi:hypothetical protein [Enterovibrio norvegicus]|uniref:hypothetical protein n=1 Tax=Enterovibrio norvegicus TaxID=188144 RepID=UPI0013D51FF1|nr:hypothetical protein [Enterovibrio norvegicus]
MIYASRSLYSLLASVLIIGIIGYSLQFTKVNADPLAESLQDTYMVAVDGNRKASEQVLKAVESLLHQYPDDPLLTAYYGSALAIKARDTWIPWYRTDFTQQGIDSLNKALSQLSERSYSTPYYGLNEGFYIQSLAAMTFINMPDYFHQSSRGYALLKDIMSSENFQYYPFAPRAWIHFGAVQAALALNNTADASKWAKEMFQLAPTHPMTVEALRITQHIAH